MKTPVYNPLQMGDKKHAIAYARKLKRYLAWIEKNKEN